MAKKKTLSVFIRLFSIIKSLLWVMAITILAGSLGAFAATAIPVLGSLGIIKLLGFDIALSYRAIIILLLSSGIIRGALRYFEHYTGHYIAFKLLAILRDNVFAKLRELCPAKLEGKEKGSLISTITSDIETLEVFYAHTIAPVMIALINSIIMVVIISLMSSVWLGIIVAFAYIVLGFVYPPLFSKRLSKSGGNYRDNFRKYNSYFLESINGIEDIMLMNATDSRLNEFNIKSDEMENENLIMKKENSKARAATDITLYFFVIVNLFIGTIMFAGGVIGIEGLIIAVVGLLSSFGPVLALSSLPSSLNQTIACGERLINLMDEEPEAEEIEKGIDIEFENCQVDNVSFSYNEKNVLQNCSLSINKRQIIGIYGKSGSGKSTLVKLLMRYWKANQGNISYNGQSIDRINSKNLRDNIAYVMQDTYVFSDTVKSNIDLRGDKSIEEIKRACSLAAIDEFIMSLEQGYETRIGAGGRNLSSGEKQRLGVARALLYNPEFIILDEVTSNIDSLNEAIILNSLSKIRDKHTIVIVSHRESTLSICDEIFEMTEGKLSKAS